MQIFLVHNIIKFYHSNPSGCQEMQGDAHPQDWDVQKPHPQ